MRYSEKSNVEVLLPKMVKPLPTEGVRFNICTLPTTRSAAVVVTDVLVGLVVFSSCCCTAPSTGLDVAMPRQIEAVRAPNSLLTDQLAVTVNLLAAPAI